MALRENFAVFILTHRRPGRVLTLGNLRSSGYTGRVYLIVDDEDPTVDEYRENFGAGNVIVFNKTEAAGLFDEADSFQNHHGIPYARNASYQIARDLGLDYILQLDDDYTFFAHKGLRDGYLTSFKIMSFDDVMEAMLTFLDDSGAATVALCQGGDFIGGIRGLYTRGLLRKAMNTFFLKVSTPVQFDGRINEDVNTYVVAGSRGRLFFSVTALGIEQSETQAATGGLTELYKDVGTYVKSFYTVMMAPSAVKVMSLGEHYHRYHHRITWDHAVPKIISDRYRIPR